MSSISSIGSIGTWMPSVQAPSASTPGGTGAGILSGSSGAYAGLTSVQESYQSTGMSVTTSVQNIVTQFGAALPQDETLRALAVLMLLAQLLDLLSGKNQDGGQAGGGLSNTGLSAGLLVLTNSGSSMSFVMESSSYHMAAGAAYASSSFSANSMSGLDASGIVSPTDTGAHMNAGDGGHQLDVVA